jgi:basic amino acid/polyamine antiporter, APA family
MSATGSIGGGAGAPAGGDAGVAAGSGAGVATGAGGGGLAGGGAASGGLTGGGTNGGPQLFTRTATGLVREGKTRDALFFNVMYSSVLLTVLFYFLLAPLSYPGSNFLVSSLIAAAFGLPGGFLYAMLTHMMPRTGGDYVFASRTLHPAVGFASNFNWMFWLTMVVGVYSTYFATYGAGAFFRMLAGYSGNRSLLDTGNWFATHWGTFITGTAFIAIFAAIFILGGTRMFFRIQRVNFYLYIGGGFLLAVLIFLFTSHASFLHSFNSYAANLGTHNAVAGVRSAAAKAGFAPSSFDWSKTLLAVTVAWYVFGFVYSTNYVAGEIRTGRRTHFYTIPGALLLTLVVVLVMIPIIQHSAGTNFLNQLGIADPSAYGFAGGVAGYPELAAIGSGSAVLGTLVILGFVAGLLAFFPMAMMLCSRAILAWSFDGVMPERLSRVDERTHTPVAAVLIIALLCIGSTAIYSFTTWFSTLVVLFPQTLTLIVVAICGIVLPYRRRELFESSGYNQRLGGVPVLSIVGFFSLIGFCGALAVLLSDPASGTSLAHNLNIILISLGILLIVAPGMYYIAKAVRARQGVDLSLAFAELPPE